MRALVAVNVFNEEAKEASFTVRAYLASMDIASDCVNSVDMHVGVKLSDLVPSVVLSEYDLAIVLGGDGTILRVARLLAGYPVPILGICFGNLGFLANSNEIGVLHIVEEALAGNLTIEHRTNISIDVYCDDCAEATDELPDHPVRTLFALNELALNRGAYGGYINIAVMIAGVHIAELNADGLVVSSSTGSTAYALSAGGPLVSPGFRGLIAVPIAPHTLRSRAIVTAPNDVIEVAVRPTRDGKTPVLSIDGEGLSFDTAISRVVARPGDVPTSLMYYSQDIFYRHVSEHFF